MIFEMVWDHFTFLSDQEYEQSERSHVNNIEQPQQDLSHRIPMLACVAESICCGVFVI